MSIIGPLSQKAATNRYPTSKQFGEYTLDVGGVYVMQNTMVKGWGGD